MMRHLLSLYLVLFVSSNALGFGGQSPTPPPLAFSPPSAAITVTTDVEYGMAGTTRLAMDVYKPATVPGSKVPALLFFNRATGAERSGRFYSAWARAAASNGVMGILPDLREGNEAARVLNGDAEAAIAWLRSIPPQFLPPSVGKDPAFAAIRDRADFRALFERR